MYRNTTVRRHLVPWALWALVVAPGALAAPAGAQPGPPESVFQGAERQEVAEAAKRLREIQGRHQDAILDRPGVHGIGIGVDPATRKLIFHIAVDTVGPVPPLPAHIEGVPVEVERSSPPVLMNGGPLCEPCHADPQSLPVPMGNSAFSATYCSACTLGFKACDRETGDIVYLTNAHCSTDSSGCAGTAPIGSDTVHRGPLDAPFCAIETDIGDVARHRTPSCVVGNTLDATKVRSSASLTSAYVRDIGTPRGFRRPWPGDAVQKSGRTTGHTYGTVEAVDYATDIRYCCGEARMIHQVKVDAAYRAFLKGGDSGSALLDRSSPPWILGLLFAGAGDGSYGIANSIVDLEEDFHISSNLTGCAAYTCEEWCEVERRECYERCLTDPERYYCELACDYDERACLYSCQ